ncbi:hypothetical protein EUGRSUZ_C01631 [Eucalyptus grandis]|uniref:Uncharacterized protein n=2 Tax=Eucalyptus grandis TaxID=71139 RepID=A0ACC3LE47_EUCGR|nr:hypothetical protein EUGRSUZ_C01631 [Eucalyptus grandis]
MLKRGLDRLDFFGNIGYSWLHFPWKIVRSIVRENLEKVETSTTMKSYMTSKAWRYSHPAKVCVFKDASL